MAFKPACRAKAIVTIMPVWSFFGHLKSESLRLHRFTSQKQLVDEVHRYIHFYNHQRFQKKLSNLSPVEYRTKVA
ncbi:IS3 family transposase [Cohnella nanjingensis]